PSGSCRLQSPHGPMSSQHAHIRRTPRLTTRDAMTDDGRVHMSAFPPPATGSSSSDLWGGTPPPQGLYDGTHEHDACGVAFVATMTGVPSHLIVSQALTALRNLEHRGAAGAEPNSGDGAGILLQVPDRFFREVTADLGFDLPAQHAYAVGTAF